MVFLRKEGLYILVTSLLLLLVSSSTSIGTDVRRIDLSDEEKVTFPKKIFEAFILKQYTYQYELELLISKQEKEIVDLKAKLACS